MGAKLYSCTDEDLRMCLGVKLELKVEQDKRAAFTAYLFLMVWKEEHFLLDFLKGEAWPHQKNKQHSPFYR